MNKWADNSFIYIGRLDELKGIRVLFEAWRMMGETAPRLIVCGTGPLESWCKEYVNQNNLMSIEMKGFLPNDEVKVLVSESRALILPTQWYEGFPMTIVEAYRVGTPVIGSNIGNVGSIIKNGITGETFEYNNVQALIEKVKQLDKFKITVPKEYAERYSEVVNYKTLMEIYKNVERRL